MSNTYFISDLHLGHVSCLTFDNRPFKDIDEHDEAIISRWNHSVKTDDTVWILGDISWYNQQKTAEIFEKLQGHKNLIIGNHDTRLLKGNLVSRYFEDIAHYKEIHVDDKNIVLCHYPIPCFKSHYHGWYHLYGHVHNGMEWNMMKRMKTEQEALWDKPHHMYNVGAMMDYINYTPRTIDWIINGSK